MSSTCILNPNRTNVYVEAPVATEKVFPLQKEELSSNHNFSLSVTYTALLCTRLEDQGYKGHFVP